MIKVDIGRLREPAAWIVLAVLSTGVLVGITQLLLGDSSPIDGLGRSLGVGAAGGMASFVSPVSTLLAVGAILLVTKMGEPTPKARSIALGLAGALGLGLVFGLISMTGLLFGGLSFRAKLESLMTGLPMMALNALGVLFALNSAGQRESRRDAAEGGFFGNLPNERNAGNGWQPAQVAGPAHSNSYVGPAQPSAVPPAVPPVMPPSVASPSGELYGAPVQGNGHAPQPLPPQPALQRLQPQGVPQPGLHQIAPHQQGPHQPELHHPGQGPGLHPFGVHQPGMQQPGTQQPGAQQHGSQPFSVQPPGSQLEGSPLLSSQPQGLPWSDNQQPLNFQLDQPPHHEQPRIEPVYQEAQPGIHYGPPPSVQEYAPVQEYALDALASSGSEIAQPSAAPAHHVEAPQSPQVVGAYLDQPSGDHPYPPQGPADDQNGAAFTASPFAHDQGYGQDEPYGRESAYGPGPAGLPGPPFEPFSGYDGSDPREQQLVQAYQQAQGYQQRVQPVDHLQGFQQQEQPSRHTTGPQDFPDYYSGPLGHPQTSESTTYGDQTLHFNPAAYDGAYDGDALSDPGWREDAIAPTAIYAPERAPVKHEEGVAPEQVGHVTDSAPRWYGSDR